MPIYYKKGDQLKAEDVQKLFALFSKLNNLQVGPGLEMLNLPSGYYLTLASPTGGAAGTVPAGEFTGQILTTLDNAPVWLLDVYVPALPG